MSRMDSVSEQDLRERYNRIRAARWGWTICTLWSHKGACLWMFEMWRPDGSSAGVVPRGGFVDEEFLDTPSWIENEMLTRVGAPL